MMIYLGAKVDVEEEGMPWEGQVNIEIFLANLIFSRSRASSDYHYQLIIFEIPKVRWFGT